MHHQDHSLITFAQRQHEEIIFPVALIDVVNKIPEKCHYKELIIIFSSNLPFKFELH